MRHSDAKVILRPGGNCRPCSTWRVNVGTATPFNPSSRTSPRPVSEYAYLWTLWQGGPVLGGDIVAWPLARPRPGRSRPAR